jgi:hypothetical protein
MRITSYIDFARKYQGLFMGKCMADAILAKAVLEMFGDAILFGEIGKIADVLC